MTPRYGHEIIRCPFCYGQYERRIGNHYHQCPKCRRMAHASDPLPIPTTPPAVAPTEAPAEGSCRVKDFGTSDTFTSGGGGDYGGGGASNSSGDW